jgi:c-di-GMP-binding flagellar brake protein YcgR
LERRKEPRIEISQEVMITLLGEPDTPPFRVVAVDMSGSGMRVLSQRPLPYQAMVKVEVGDLLLLGEVIRVQAGERGNLVALKFWHSLDPGTVHQITGPSGGT